MRAVQRLLVIHVLAVFAASCAERKVEISSVSPAVIEPGTTSSVTVKGSNLNQISSIAVPGGIQVSRIAKSEDSLNFLVQVDPNFSPAAAELDLQNKDGQVLSRLSLQVNPSSRQTLAKLEDGIRQANQTLSSLKSELTESQENLERRMTTLRNQVAQQGRQFGASLAETRKQMDALEQSYKVVKTDLEQKIQALDSEQKRLSGMLDSQQSRLDKELADLRELYGQQSSDTQLALQSIYQMGQKKVGGIIGFRRHPLLEENYREELQKRLQPSPYVLQER